MTRLVSGSATDVGLVRANNQDQLLVTDDDLFAVADGMGGHAAGEVASLTAVEALAKAFQAATDREPGSLLAAAREANRAVWERAGQNPAFYGMGTTLVAMARVHSHLVGAAAAKDATGSATLAGNPGSRSEGVDKLAVVHVGDSRVYRFRDGQLQQLTVDHSVVQELIDDGQIDEQEAAIHPRRHVLTRALGVDPDVDVDLIEVDPVVGDRFLLCSDGLCREVSDEHLASLLGQTAHPFELADRLVTAAKEHGGSDNITVVVVDVVDTDVTAEATGSQSDGADGDIDLPDPAPLLLGTGQNEEPDTVQLPKLTGPPAPTPGANAAARRPKRARLVTPRVIGFLLLLVLVVGVAVAGIGWYARGSYFVGLRADRLTIFKGRPGGVLWFEPTVARRTTVTTSDVLSSRLQALRAGQPEPSVRAAEAYIHNLTAEATTARRVDNPSYQPLSSRGKTALGAPGRAGSQSAPLR